MDLKQLEKLRNCLFKNYANCDMLSVLIPFQIFILSAVQSFSKTEWYFYKKKPKMCFFVYCCYFFAHNCIIILKAMPSNTLQNQDFGSQDFAVVSHHIFSLTCHNCLKQLHLDDNDIVLSFLTKLIIKTFSHKLTLFKAEKL